MSGRAHLRVLRDVAAEADWLSSLLGPAPGDEEWSPALASWHERFALASARVGELARGDSKLLRLAAGGEDHARPGRMLLITAAIRAEQATGVGEA